MSYIIQFSKTRYFSSVHANLDLHCNFYHGKLRYRLCRIKGIFHELPHSGVEALPRLTIHRRLPSINKNSDNRNHRTRILLASILIPFEFPM